MKSVRMILLMSFLLVAAQMLSGCSDTPAIDTEPSGKFTHFVDVYLEAGPTLSDIMNNKVGDNLWLYPGDILIVNNISEYEATVAFPEGLCKVLSDKLPVLEDGKVKITIESRRRVMLKVLKKVTDEDAFDFSVGAVKALGAPKVKVGEGP